MSTMLFAHCFALSRNRFDDACKIALEIAPAPLPRLDLFLFTGSCWQSSCLSWLGNQENKNRKADSDRLFRQRGELAELFFAFNSKPRDS